MERNKYKIGWTIALVTIGWGFVLLPSAEDLPEGEPMDRFDWIMWTLINVLAVVAIHYWRSQPHREARRRWENERRAKLVADRRAKINARRNHPTAH
jgi:hypothetical protein